MISIVIISYNRSNLLQKTLKSIINQTLKDLEIILVDDGSDDNTLAMINSLNEPRIKYYNFGRIGNLSKLRNLGIKHSNYELIAFCDDDDLWSPDKLKEQIKFMDLYDFICSNATVIDFDGNNIKDKYFDEINSSFEISKEFLLSKGNCILTSSCLLKRKAFDELDEMFDENTFTNYCEDYELFIRLSNHCKIFFINEKLIYKRSHGSVSGGLDNSLKMLNTSVKILSAFREKEENTDDALPVEGILGFKILSIKYAFRKNISAGITELTDFLAFISGKNIFSVFINKKVKPKLKDIFSLKFY